MFGCLPCNWLRANHAAISQQEYEALCMHNEWNQWATDLSILYEQAKANGGRVGGKVNFPPELKRHLTQAIRTCDEFRAVQEVYGEERRAKAQMRSTTVINKILKQKTKESRPFLKSFAREANRHESLVNEQADQRRDAEDIINEISTASAIAIPVEEIDEEVEDEFDNMITNFRGGRPPAIKEYDFPSVPTEPLAAPKKKIKPREAMLA